MTHLFQRPYPVICALCLTGMLLFLSGFTGVTAQEDTTVTPSVTAPKIKDSSAVQPYDSADTRKLFLFRSKGLIGRLAKSITTDTGKNEYLTRIDLLYARYSGRIIRNIEVRNVDFGVPINDTLRSFKNTLTRMADAVHSTTKGNVIRNNLFFKQYDTLLPSLLADNERHLRDQTYIADANIIVRRVVGTTDSVDVIVLTKDVLSIGGSIEMHSPTNVEAAIREDNFGGWGDKFEISGLYDQKRRKKTGFGTEYTSRNIGGSFIDGYLGYKDFASTFNSGLRQETTLYTRILRPLVNPYLKWTYAFEAAWHKTSHMYFSDSVYLSDLRYQYYNVDAWVGFNMSARQLTGGAKDDRLRTLVGLRFLHQDFQQIPEKYINNYYYQFANITGLLASISLFRQDFYKTQYVYGFGRNEDVPEGLDVSLTTGWTNKQQRVRPYMGLDVHLNYFSKHDNYFNYTFRIGGYSYKRRYEDISILGSMEFFTRLRQLSRTWKQRTFITATLATQYSNVLNEPLLLESQYGLPEYQDIRLGGDHRLTVKAESVFFNNWSFFSFKFAPFVFGNASFITPHNEGLGKTNMYKTIGAGLRSRNESLVFGTLELRMYYFPGGNFNGDNFRIDFNSNIKFKYNSLFIRRPEFIQVN